MFDIKWIRENAEAFDEGMKRRGLEPQAASLIAIDDERRAHIAKLQEAQTRRNAASKEIGKAMGSGDTETAEKLKAEVGELKSFVQQGEDVQRELDEKLTHALEVLPNLPLDDVPVGEDEDANTLYREHGAKPELGFEAKEHFEIGEAHGLMDFEAAAKLAGARFTVLKGDLARLERALGQFMMDVHTQEHGYMEVNPPLIVKDHVLYGTGQLPKFEEDLYCLVNEYERLKAVNNMLGKVNWAFSVENEWLIEFNAKFDRLMRSEIEKGRDVSWVASLFTDLSKHFTESSGRFDDFSSSFQKLETEFQQREKSRDTGQWLIPTAEVPLTNMVAGEIVAEKDLPMRMTALTPCFRSEAGSAGRDTRGMLRQHQFWKTELVSITTPEESLNELERMLDCAESVLKKLGLHYRVMTLSSGDMGFGARRTYDIEVWLPGQNAYREISSCSVCGDFQARRMNARYRLADGKTLAHVHTLNGSGVAVGRALIAVLENCQNEDGSVTIPEVLVPYMGGKTKIGKAG